MMAISSGRSELEELVLINDLLLSGGSKSIYILLVVG